MNLQKKGEGERGGSRGRKDDVSGESLEESSPSLEIPSNQELLQQASYKHYPLPVKLPQKQQKDSIMLEFTLCKATPLDVQEGVETNG